MKQPGFMLAAAGSGNGKTLITCGLIKAFIKKGYRISAFKCGPDYLDPQFYRRIADIPAGNLDTYFADEDTVRSLYQEYSQGADLSVVEGVMGYYDGIGGVTTGASAFELADQLQLPVVLIVDCKGMSLSVLAVIQGFLAFRTPNYISGIILNRVSEMFYPRLKEAIEQQCNLPVCGYVPEVEEMHMPHQYLGLKVPEDNLFFEEKLDRFADLLLKTVAVDRLAELAGQIPEMNKHQIRLQTNNYPVAVGVAYDEAFSFYYRENLDLFRKMGAEIHFFSPMRDAALPDGVSGLIFGGGYPEHYAGILEKNEEMRTAVRVAVANGMPCLAECGGFLYLHDRLEDSSGNMREMAGVFPGRSWKKGKTGRFGYIEIELQKDSVMGQKGTKIRGHEFHYYESQDTGTDAEAKKPVGKRKWPCLHLGKNIAAGFPHLAFYTNPDCAENFLASCVKFREMNEKNYEKI